MFPVDEARRTIIGKLNDEINKIEFKSDDYYDGQIDGLIIAIRIVYEVLE